MNPLIAVDELVTEPSAVAEKITVHFVVVSVYDPAQRAVALAYAGVAAGGAMHTNRWRHLQVPFSGVMPLQRRIGEHARGTDFNQVPAELVFKGAIFESAEVHSIAEPKRVQIVPSGVLAVIAHAALALNAPVHLVIHQWAEVLIPKCALAKPVVSRAVTGHHGHILQMTLASLIAHGAIVRMVLHQTLNHRRPKFHRFGIFDRNSCALR